MILSGTAVPTSPVLAWLEVRGFRAFGTEPRHMDLDAPLVVVHGHNGSSEFRWEEESAGDQEHA